MKETTIEEIEQGLQEAFNDPVWIDSFTKEVATDIENNIKDNLSWTSNLKNNVKVISNNSKIIISMPLYGLVIDRGRRPGSKMPPVKIIEGWCKLKSIDIKYAYPIARAISKRGIKAKPFITKSISVNISKKVVDFMIETLNEIIK